MAFATAVAAVGVFLLVVCDRTIGDEGGRVRCT